MGRVDVADGDAAGGEAEGDGVEGLGEGGAEGAEDGGAVGAGFGVAAGLTGGGSDLLELCDATPEDDTPDDVAKGTVRLPSGKTLDVADSTAREKREAAKELREAGDGSSGGKGTRGMSTSAEDRRVAAEAEAALHAAGLKRARVRAVARPGKVGDLRIDGIPTSGMARLCKALCGRRGK